MVTGSPTDAATSGTIALPPTDPALLGTGLIPDGWQVVEEDTGACRIAVPGDWTTDVPPGFGQSLDFKAVASVAVPPQDWETYRDTVDELYITGNITLIDTENAILIASPPGTDGDFSYVLGMRFDETTCQVLVVVAPESIAQYAAPAVLIGQTLDEAE